MYTITGILWQFLNKELPYHDAAWHTLTSFTLAKDLGLGNLDPFYLFHRYSTYHPPGVFWIGGLVSLLSNNNYIAMNIASFTIFILLLIMVYKLACLLSDQKGGFFALVFTSLMLNFVRESRLFMIDIPMCLWIITSLFFLIKARGFSQPMETLGFGAAFALALFTKLISGVFILPFALYVLYTSWNKTANWRKQLTLFLISMAAASYLVTPWVYSVLDPLLEQSRLYGTAESDDPQGLDPNSIKYYIRELIENGISVLGAILYLYTVALAVMKKIKSKYILLFASISTILYLFFTFIVENKNGRYMMPVYLFICIILGLGASEYFKTIKQHWIGKILSISTAVWLIFLFLNNSFGLFGVNGYKDIKLPSQWGVIQAYNLQSKFITDVNIYVKYGLDVYQPNQKAVSLLQKLQKQKGNPIQYSTSSLLSYFQHPKISILLDLSEGINSTTQYQFSSFYLDQNNGETGIQQATYFASNQDVIFLMSNKSVYDSDRIREPSLLLQQVVPQMKNFCLYDTFPAAIDNAVQVYVNTDTLGSSVCK